MIPSTRAEAKQVGSKHYAPGTACANGHVAPRFTSCGYCTTCSKERAERKKEELRAYYKARYQSDRPRFLEQCRENHMRNRDRNNAAAADWARRNPEKRKAISRQYKAKRRAQEEVGIGGGTLAAWTRDQPKVCFYCDADCEGNFHIDHFMPLAKGGAHVLNNLRVSCAPCNLHKSDKLPDVWMSEVARSMVNPAMVREAA